MFTIDELNTDCSAAMSLVLVATGETFVILRGGIDLSVGGTISLATALATTLFRGNSTTAFWAEVIVVIGGVIGLINGFLITVLELQPFLVTLAMWSMVGGAAMMILTEGGTLPEYWVSARDQSVRGPLAGRLGINRPPRLVGMVSPHANMHRDPIRRVKRTQRILVRRFLTESKPRELRIVRGICFGPLALFLADFSGLRIANSRQRFRPAGCGVRVIGGTSLFGGRGSLVGTIIGAFILTTIGNVVFVLGISNYWQPVLLGVVLVLAVLAASVGPQSATQYAGEP